MAETRLGGLPVVADESAVVMQEVTEIDDRGRLHLLPRWANRVDWLPLPAKIGDDASMVFSEPCLASLRDWEVDGPRIVQRYMDLSKEPNAEALEAMRLIQDRYGRLLISSGRSLYLGDAALAHLGLPIARGIKSIVYVVILPDRIDLLSSAYRNAKLIVGGAHIDDLP
jgi:hypothetical protein